MNRQDFNTWMEDFGVRFPDDHAWLGNQDGTAEVWFVDVFSCLPLADCLAMSRDITSGKRAKPWAAYERSQIAAHYGAEVRQQSYDSIHTQEERAKRDRGMAARSRGADTFADSQMQEALLSAIEMRKEGRAEEVRAMLDEVFGDDDEPTRYRCLGCLDEGIVKLAGGWVRCNCKAAERWGTQWGRGQRRFRSVSEVRAKSYDEFEAFT